MDSLDPELGRLLQNVVTADGGAQHRFAPMFIATNPAPIAVAPYIEDPQLLLPDPVGRLADLGLLDVEPAGATGAYGAFRLTAAGREAAARAAEEAERGRQTAEQQVVSRLTGALAKALSRTSDPAEQAAIQQLCDAAPAIDPAVLAAAIRRAAEG